MDVGDNGVGVGNAALKLRNDGVSVHDTPMDIINDGMGVRNTPMNVGNDYICTYREFGLEADG